MLEELNKDDHHVYQFVRASSFEFNNDIKYDCLVKKDLFDNLNKFFKEFRPENLYKTHSHEFWAIQNGVN